MRLRYYNTENPCVDPLPTVTYGSRFCAQLCLWKIPALRHLQAGGRGSAEAQWSKPAATGFAPLAGFGHRNRVDGITIVVS